MSMNSPALLCVGAAGGFATTYMAMQQLLVQSGLCAHAQAHSSTIMSQTLGVQSRAKADARLHDKACQSSQAMSETARNIASGHNIALDTRIISTSLSNPASLRSFTTGICTCLHMPEDARAPSPHPAPAPQPPP